MARKYHNEQEEAAAYRKAFDSGKRAKSKGWERLSPYVRDKWAEWWFYAGFDGKLMGQAWTEFRAAHREREEDLVG